MNTRHLLLVGILCLGTMLPVTYAQSNQFRETQAYLSLGFGPFTYYGPKDLSGNLNAASNYVIQGNLGVAVMGSFPLARNRFFFRGMVGLANFDLREERRIVGNGVNEFLTRSLVWFEPEFVWVLRSGRDRWMPYLFTGFGAHIADPLRRNPVERNDSGGPGPERTVFSWPLGAGLDYAYTPRFSFFVEASYRVNFNYVVRNEQRRIPHNTSFVMAGFRVGIYNPFKRAFLEKYTPPPLPPPAEIPQVEIAAPPPIQVCSIADKLNSVFFDYMRTDLDAEARSRLRENVEVLLQEPCCAVRLEGFADTREPDGIRLAEERIRRVYEYYLQHGIPPERIEVRPGQVAYPSCDKEDPGPGCRRNRRVDSIPVPLRTASCGG